MAGGVSRGLYEGRVTPFRFMPTCSNANVDCNLLHAIKAGDNWYVCQDLICNTGFQHLEYVALHP